MLIEFPSRKKFQKLCASYLRTNKTEIGNSIPAISYRYDLKYVKVLAILELTIFFAEQPGQHLSGFHASSHDTSGFVPVATAFAAATAVSVFLVSLYHFQTNLIEYTDQKLVDIMINAYWHFDEFCTVGASQTFPIYNA